MLDRARVPGNRRDDKINMKILFLDILTGDSKVREEINRKVYKGSTYSEAMRKAFSLDKKEWAYCDASKGMFPQKLGGFDGVVIGGSVEDPVTGQEKPWMVTTYKFIRKIVKSGLPLLGICGGLQFTVRALGKKVILNPKGRELGTLPISLTRSGEIDPLFNGLPQKINVELSHKVMAHDLKKEWKLLASSELCKTQAIAISDRIRLVQFHPEMKRGELRSIAKTRKKLLIEIGFVKNGKKFDEFLSSIKSTDAVNKRILKNFLNYFVLPFIDKKPR